MTSPLALGWNVELIAPVVALNATRLVRGSSVVLVALRTRVNSPPSTIMLPTWAIALTCPSSTCGVKFAATSPTSLSCGTW